MLAAGLATACLPSPLPSGGDAGVDGGLARGDLPVVHPFDAGAAIRGERLFTQHSLGNRLVPLIALRNVWIVWGTGPIADDVMYWKAFGEMYGLSPSPFPNGGLPLGLHAVDAADATLDCLACHADTIGGRVVIGAGNSRFDLQGLYADLARLAALAPMFGFPPYQLPFSLNDATGAAGANDAMGLGMQLAQRWAPSVPVNTTYGYQQAPPWWSLKYKQVHYTDGSGAAGGYRTMMATLLASSQSLAELQAQDAAFADLHQYLLSLEPPKWPSSVDSELAAAGRAVFERQCADCHGHHDGVTPFPNRVVPVAELGTDPLRAQRFGPAEAAFVNASWFGADVPMRSTGGYLAPVLVGVWATAPYFHNGSVPTLEAVLDSTKRPLRWRRLGADAASYDDVAVGWRTLSVAAPVGQQTLEARKTFDCSVAGLSCAGHTFGDALSADERRAVLEYLKTL